MKSGFDPGTVIFTIDMVHFITFVKGFRSNTIELIMSLNGLFTIVACVVRTDAKSVRRAQANILYTKVFVVALKDRGRRCAYSNELEGATHCNYNR